MRHYHRQHQGYAGQKRGTYILRGNYLAVTTYDVPVAGTSCQTFKGLSFRAKLLTSWVGLKGAGPILFALYTVIEGVEGSNELFNIVFTITLLSLLLQGMTISPMARLLNMSIDDDPEVETFGMEIPEEMGMLRDHIVSTEDLENGETLRDLHLPHGIRVMMVRRDEKYIVPHGSMKLMVGDRLVIIMGDTDD